jgi:hypothetical protein
MREWPLSIGLKRERQIWDEVRPIKKNAAVMRRFFVALLVAA